jgi:hypothetical protein
MCTRSRPFHQCTARCTALGLSLVIAIEASERGIETEEPCRHCPVCSVPCTNDDAGTSLPSV